MVVGESSRSVEEGLAVLVVRNLGVSVGFGVLLAVAAYVDVTAPVSLIACAMSVTISSVAVSMVCADSSANGAQEESIRATGTNKSPKISCLNDVVIP